LLGRAAAFVANHEFWLLWIYGLPLLLASSLPPILFAAAIGTIPLFWLARRMAGGRWSRATPLDLPIVLLLGMGAVGVAVSAERETSLVTFGQLLGGVALFYGVVNGVFVRNRTSDWGVAREVRSAREVRRAVWLVILLGAGMGLLGALGLRYSEKFFSIPQLLSIVPHLDFPFFNPSGFTPNIVAGAVAPVIPLCWAAAASRAEAVSWKARGALLVLSLLLGAVVVLTQSRGAVLGLGAALVVLIFWRAPRAIWLAPVGVVCAVVAFDWLGAASAANFFLSDEVSAKANGRLELWNRALSMLQDFPFTGIGLGRFPEMLFRFYPVFVNSMTAPLPHAHNLYLQMGVDYGVPGLVAFLGLVTSALGVGIVALYRTREMTQGWVAAGVLAGYVVYLTHGLVDAVAVSTKVSVVVWFLLAVMVLLFARDENR